ncbi:hypothetical protein PG994_013748 [Apiospora phragmitis]|uniref:Uncharacterized protein n=1 Tax=Apiospora phragmitis TaxID=2905665 RepID=A0ABR1T2C5_9PEZI
MATHDSDNATEIYGHQAKVTKFKNYEVLSRQAANTLTLRDKEQHSRRRRVILAKIDKFCELLRHQSKEALEDEATGFNNLAFDIMTKVLFDIDFNTMGSAEYRYAMKAIEESNLAIGFLDRRLFAQALHGRRQFVKFIRMVMAKRLGFPKGYSRDLFSHLQECIDPVTGKGLNTAELSTETATFIVAGMFLPLIYFIPSSRADTSSTSMAAVSHYLTGSSHCCVCLRACIDESLRLFLPGGSALWREVELGGAFIAGDFIPEGCEVAVGVYSVQYSTKYYDRPFEFDASR